MNDSQNSSTLVLNGLPAEPPSRPNADALPIVDRGSCRRCQVMPEPQAAVGRLFLWIPLGHSVHKAFQQLSDMNVPYQLCDDKHSLIVPTDDDILRPVVDGLVEVLTRGEQEATRVLFLEGNRAPQLADMGRVKSLHQFHYHCRADWLVSMFEEDRLTSYFQPIVHADRTDHIYAYEALLRGRERDGTVVSPGPIFDVASNADLLFQLDRRARMCAIDRSIAVELNKPVFINFTPTAVYDPVYCLRSTVEHIRRGGIDPSQVVFEVVESTEVKDTSHLKDILDYYRDAGFRVALDDLGAGYSSLNMIHQIRPDIVKLDMDLTRDIAADDCRAMITARILDLARDLGIQTVAEGVETQEDMRWLQEHGVDYMQGYLFATPSERPVRQTPRFA